MFKDMRRMKRREGWRGGSTDLKRVEADSLAGGKGGTFRREEAKFCPGGKFRKKHGNIITFGSE